MNEKWFMNRIGKVNLCCKQLLLQLKINAANFIQAALANSQYIAVTADQLQLLHAGIVIRFGNVPGVQPGRIIPVRLQRIKMPVFIFNYQLIACCRLVTMYIDEQNDDCITAI